MKQGICSKCCNTSCYSNVGFELGFSVTNPRALVCWEAQFGDFNNTAQVFVVVFCFTCKRRNISQVFDHVSKHQEWKLKNEAQPSFLTKVRGVWKHDQPLVRVFDTTSQTNVRTSGENEGESLLIYASV